MSPKPLLLRIAAARAAPYEAILRLENEEVCLKREGVTGCAKAASAEAAGLMLSFLLHGSALAPSWFVYRAGTPILQIGTSSSGPTFLDGRGVVAARARRRWRPLRWIAPWLPRRSTFRSDVEILDHDRHRCTGALEATDWRVVRRVDDDRPPSEALIRPLEAATILTFALLLAPE